MQFDAQCSRLTVTEGVETVDAGLLVDCDAAEVVVPESVREIKENAFCALKLLRSLAFDPGS